VKLSFYYASTIVRVLRVCYMPSDLVQAYVTCWRNCHLRTLESLAMWGLAVKAWIEECGGEKRFKKVKLELFDGSVVESGCFLDEEVFQSIRIINAYIGFARQNNAIENIKVVD